MAVNEEVSGYSTTPASNTPAGTATVGPDLDNHLRDMKKNIRAVGQTFLGSTEGNFDGALKVDNSASPVWTLGINYGGTFISLLDIDVSAGLGASIFGREILQEGTASARDTVMGNLGAAASEDSTASAVSRFIAGVVADAINESSTASARTTLMGSVLGNAANETATASAQDALGLSYASQAELESASATDRVSSPGTMHHHPGMAKAWVNFNGSGGASINASYNVSSVTRNNTGDYTINFDTDFSSANYAAIISGGDGNTTYEAYAFDAGPRAAGSFRFLARRISPSAIVDIADVSVVFFGDQ